MHTLYMLLYSCIIFISYYIKYSKSYIKITLQIYIVHPRNSFVSKVVGSWDNCCCILAAHQDIFYRKLFHTNVALLLLPHKNISNTYSHQVALVPIAYHSPDL